MKTITIILLSTTFSFAQVQIDKPLQLTGSGMDARIEGIDTVAHAKDAVNAETVQYGSLLYAVATGTDSLHFVSLPHFTGQPKEGMNILVKMQRNCSLVFQYLVINGHSARIRQYGLMPDPEVAAATADIRSGYVYQFVFDGVQWRFNY